MASSPGAPFAGLFSDESAVEAVYRFMRNSEVDWEQILAAHVDVRPGGSGLQPGCWWLAQATRAWGRTWFLAIWALAVYLQVLWWREYASAAGSDTWGLGMGVWGVLSLLGLGVCAIAASVMRWTYAVWGAARIERRTHAGVIAVMVLSLALGFALWWLTWDWPWLPVVIGAIAMGTGSFVYVLAVLRCILADRSRRHLRQS